MSDVGHWNAAWVLLPGLAAWAVAGGLLLLRPRTLGRGRPFLSAAAVGLWLFGVWWTLGGVGAWRAGVTRLANGTANVTEGTLAVTAAGDCLQVADVSLCRTADALLPPLHASRWPAVQRLVGQQVRLSFFGADVLRLEVAARP